MAGDKKLDALSRRLEVVEQQIIETQLTTKKILEEREGLLTSVILECEKIENELGIYRKSLRPDSIRSGDIGCAVLVCAAEKKLERQIVNLRKIISERTNDVARARERLSSINEELKENRSANKRLDRLIESREQMTRVIRYAGDEMAQDELSKKGIK